MKRLTLIVFLITIFCGGFAHAQLQIKDANGDTKNLNATGDGTPGNPYVPGRYMVDEFGNNYGVKQLGNKPRILAEIVDGAGDPASVPVTSPSPLNCSGATVPVSSPAALDVSGATVPVSSPAPLNCSGATVNVASPAPLNVSGATVPVSSPLPLDVSGATVPVSSPLPLDVSGATVPVSSPAPLDVSGATVPVSAAVALPVSSPAPLDVSGATVPVSTPSPLDAAVQLKDEVGVAYGVKHVGNKPRVVSSPYYAEIAKGNIAGHTSLLKFGHAGDVDNNHTSLLEGAPAGTQAHFPATAQQLKIRSTSTLDTSAGTGARTVLINYLDSNYAEQTETVTLNGTTNVTTTASMLRVNSMAVITAGSTKLNQGTIVAYDNGGTLYISTIAALHNYSSGPHYTVPAGVNLYLTRGFFNTDGDKALHMDFYVTVPVASGGTGLRNSMFYIPLHAESVNLDFDFPFVLPEKTDLDVQAFVETGTANCSAGWEGWIE